MKTKFIKKHIISLGVISVAVLLLIFSFAVPKDEVYSKKFNINLKANNLKIVKKGNFHQVYMDGANYSHDPGNPILPYQIYYVLFPKGVVDSSLSIKVIKKTEIELKEVYNIPPAGPYMLHGSKQPFWGEKKKIINGKNINIYNNNITYPSQPIKYNIQHLGDKSILCLFYYPVQYKPKSGKLVRSSFIEVEISYTTSNIKIGEDAKICKRDYIYKEYDLLRHNYLIITTDEIKNESLQLNEFIKHKEALGFDVSVATTEEINKCYPDAKQYYQNGISGLKYSTNELADKIRIYLQHLQTPPIYVLLIGDPSDPIYGVPMKIFKIWVFNNAPPTDHYYADLTGIWDNNSDGKYGDGGDDFVECYVGRIPVYRMNVVETTFPYEEYEEIDNYYNDSVDTMEIAEEYNSPYNVSSSYFSLDIEALDKILQKTINYENDVFQISKNALLAMKPLGGKYLSYPLGEKIKSEILDPSDWETCRIYDKCWEDDVNSPKDIITPCTKDNVLNEWEHGYCLVAWSTHGQATNAEYVMDVKNTKFLDDTKPAFVYQSSCLNGCPEYPNNLGFSLLKNGAIATICATRETFFGTLNPDILVNPVVGYTVHNDEMVYNYVKYICIGFSAGYSFHVQSKKVTDDTCGFDRCNYGTLNLYGDPSLIMKNNDKN